MSFAFSHVGPSWAPTPTSGTTLVCTIGAVMSVDVGEVIIITTGWDNVDTTDVNPTRLSVTDSKGNTYSRIREFVNGQGVAAAGVHVGVFYSRVATQILTDDTITITSNAAASAKVMNSLIFTCGSSISVSAAIDLANDASDPGSMEISGLSSASRLYLRSIGAETDTSTFTETSGFTNPLNHRSVTGMAVLSEFKIATSTGETSNPSASNVDCASIFMALSDTAVPGAPTLNSVTAGVALVDAAWSAPSSDGGSAITDYTLYASPDGHSQSAGTGLSVRMTGLTAEVQYTFTVKATNAIGQGPASNSILATPFADPAPLARYLIGNAL